MMRILTALPKNVMISLAVIAGALVILALAIPFLGGGRDDTFAENARLQGEISRINAAITQSKSDQLYVAENLAKFEELIKSDRLVPHTRRAAVIDLEEKARSNGLTGLNYSIGAVATNSLRAVAGQPSAGTYRVSLEEIALKVAAPLDGAVYRFIDAITQKFPGAAVVHTLTLMRGATPATGVQGEIGVSWRTAQEQEKKP